MLHLSKTFTIEVADQNSICNGNNILPYFWHRRPIIHLVFCVFFVFCHDGPPILVFCSELSCSVWFCLTMLVLLIWWTGIKNILHCHCLRHQYSLSEVHFGWPNSLRKSFPAKLFQHCCVPLCIVLKTNDPTFASTSCCDRPATQRWESKQGLSFFCNFSCVQTSITLWMSSLGYVRHYSHM